MSAMYVTLQVSLEDREARRGGVKRIGIGVSTRNSGQGASCRGIRPLNGAAAADPVCSAGTRGQAR